MVHVHVDGASGRADDSPPSDGEIDGSRRVSDGSDQSINSLSALTLAEQRHARILGAEGGRILARHSASAGAYSVKTCRLAVACSRNNPTRQ